MQSARTALTDSAIHDRMQAVARSVPYRIPGTIDNWMGYCIDQTVSYLYFKKRKSLQLPGDDEVIDAFKSNFSYKILEDQREAVRKLRWHETVSR